MLVKLDSHRKPLAFTNVYMCEHACVWCVYMLVHAPACMCNSLFYTYADIMAGVQLNVDVIIQRLTDLKFWVKLEEFVWKLIPECEEGFTTEIKRALAKHLFIQLLKSGALNEIAIVIEAGCTPALLSLLQFLGVIQAIASCVKEASKRNAAVIIQNAALVCSKEVVKEGTKQALKQGSKEAMKQGARKVSVAVAKNAAKSTIKGAA